MGRLAIRSCSFWFCLLFGPWMISSFNHSRRLSGVVSEVVPQLCIYTKQFTGLILTCCLFVCLWWWECNEIQFRLHLHITNNTWNNFMLSDRSGFDSHGDCGRDGQRDT